MNGHTRKSLNEISNYISICHVKIRVRCDFLDKIQTTTDDEEKTTLVQSHDVLEKC